MIHAYNKDYLSDSMPNLGEAFDYACNVCQFTPDDFFNMMVISGIAAQFGTGNPKYVCGKTGTELVMDVMLKTGLSVDGLERRTEYIPSPEYWLGWFLAYFQWYSGRTFENIREVITMAEILQQYPILHEVSEQRAVDTINHIIKRKNLPIRLQTRRKSWPMTQRELSIRSGVNLRTIQQYEARSKDINKASAITLFALARTLACKMEDLIEYDCSDCDSQENATPK